MKLIRHVIFIFCLLNIVAIAAQAEPFDISPDGNEVTDQKTGYIWRRCVEGMKFSKGTCKGKPTLFTYKGALRQAEEQSDSTKRWIVPQGNVLLAIVDQTRFDPAIDPKAFPNTPFNICQWSGELHEINLNYAWIVCFKNGDFGRIHLGDTNYVRLMRNPQ